MPSRSLRVRALQWLAQREQSRTELRCKLMPHARAEVEAERRAEAEAPAEAEAGRPPIERSAPQPAVERVDALLDWLEAHEYLSQQRFVESRVHARQGRFGNLRIREELKAHRATLAPDAVQALNDSELQRALQVLAKKFGQPPTDLAERGRQFRFLSGRGFSSETIQRALRDAARPAADPQPGD